jgi:hypothetical protein
MIDDDTDDGQIGGSRGHVSMAGAKRYPDLKFLIQDRAEVIVETEKQCPPFLRDQISFMTHNFMTPQPITTADVYMLRWMIHDWSDKYAVRILRSIIPTMKTGAKIVLVEGVLPEPNSSQSMWRS